MAGETQDRIIVHASLDMFDDRPSPSHDDRGSQAGSSQPARSSSVAVQPKRGEGLGGSSRAQHVGYANRHIQRCNRQESSPKRVQHRAQPQGGSITAYLPPAAGSETQIQPEMLRQQETIAASGLNGDHRSQGHMKVADKDDQQVQTPPRWRRISAATPGAPQQDYSTSPSIHRLHGNGRQRRNNNPRREEGGRAPTGEEVEHYSPSRRTGGVSGYGGEYGEHASKPEGGCPWGGSPQRDSQQQTSPYPSDGPEYPHYHHAPDTRNLRGGGHRRYIGGGEAEGTLSYDEGGRREDNEREPYPDTRHRENRGAGEYGARSRAQNYGGRGGKYQNPLPHGGRYHNPTIAGAESREDRGGGSSNRRSNGRHGMIHGHADGGEQENKSMETGRGGAKHAEAAGGRERHTTQKTHAPFSSVRRQLSSPNASPLQSDTRSAPRKTQPQRVNVSPARHGPGVAETDDTKPNPESLNEALVKSPKDMLLFSKKARQVDYKPCTLKEYRESKPTGYVELGKLQPDLYTDELVAKRANAERIKEFSANLRKINSGLTAAARRSTANYRAARKEPAQDSRSKGLAFASRVPLPKKRPQKNAASAEPPFDPADPRARRRVGRRTNGTQDDEGWKSRELTELEALEREHDEMRRKVQAARSIF